MFEIENKSLENKEKSDKYIEEFKSKIMSLVMGIKCVDGIFLAGDRRLVDVNLISEEKKIKSPFKNFVIGYSGETAYMQYLMSKIDNYSTIPNEKNDWDVFCRFLEDSCNELYKRYESRISNLGFDALYIVKKSIDHAELCHLFIKGSCYTVYKYDVIGSGMLYAQPFLKTLYFPEITMDQASQLCTFILKLINEFNLDFTVGGNLRFLRFQIKEISKKHLKKK